MNKGRCPVCKQNSELHEGVDGLWYCEDCLVRGGRDKESQRRVATPMVEGAKMEVNIPSSNGRRQELLDYIISVADEEWIDIFLYKYAQSLKDGYGWIRMIEGEQDEFILLRMASELGFGKKVATIVRGAGEKIVGGRERNPKGKVNRRSRKTVKRRVDRTSATAASRPVSVPST